MPSKIRHAGYAAPLRAGLGTTTTLHIVAELTARARETAAPVARELHLPVHPDERIIEAHNHFEGLHVDLPELLRPRHWPHLRNLATWAVEYEVVYWIKTDDYFVFMDTNQVVLLDVLRGLAERGIDIAFPTQLNVRPTEVYNAQDAALHWPPMDKGADKGAGA